MGLNRELLGTTYDDHGSVVTAEAIAAYARATNSDSARYLGPGDVVAPPLFGVVVTHHSIRRALLDPALRVDTPRLLHTEQVMRFVAPIRPGDRLRSTTRISFLGDSRGGELMDLHSRALRDDGSLVYESVVGLLIRYEARKAQAELLPAIGEARTWPATAAAGAEVLLERSAQVAADQSARYSAASLDDNPIHLDEAFARAVGLPGKILHGLCTLAMAQHAIVDAAAGGDPTRLRSLCCKFTRPVLMGDTLTTRGLRLADEGGARRLGFEVLNQAGKAVIKEGVAEIAR